MNFFEIALAFKNCNGDINLSFKEFLINQKFISEDLSKGISINNANNYILRDIEYLLNKAIINIGASDLLLKKGYFHWGFITSYYSNFFSIQALNRLQLDFNTWIDSGIDCTLKNYNSQEIFLKYSNSSVGSHEAQFNRYYRNFENFKYKKSIDRYWTIGIQPFKMRFEPLLRNEINYQIEKDYYYELNLEYSLFESIIRDNKQDLSKKQVCIKSPTNYSLPNLELAISRFRVAIYILNFIANSNIEYKSYFIRNINSRLLNLKTKYPNISAWILNNFEQWLQFTEIETDNILNA